MSQFTQVLVPEDVGADDEEIDEIALSTWFFDDGDQVKEGAVICQLMVAKASIDVVAPVAGVLRHVAKAEAVVQVGDLIARIET